MDVPTLSGREKGAVMRLEGHCSAHCPARSRRGLAPSGRRSALIAGMARRVGAQGCSGICRTWCPAPPAVHSAWGPALDLQREPLGDAEGWVRATCCWPVGTL